MTVIAISDDTFEQEVLNSAEPVLVDFFAEWCGPCKAMAPALGQAAEELAGKIKIVKVDVDKSPATRDACAIRGMPTLLMYKGGKVVGRHMGALVQKAKLLEWIDSASAVSDAPAEPRAEEFKLANGLQVVVIPSPNATSVTIRTLYKMGLADDWSGAIMLRTLLAAAPDTAQPVPAHVGMDITTFVQSVAKDELQTALQKDAARMSPLNISEDDLSGARQMATEAFARSGPGHKHQINAAVYGAHPYALQIGGEAERLAKLSGEDLVHLHKRYCAPNNAVVIIAGPVTTEDVKRLAEETYGQAPANPEVGMRTRLQLAPIEAGQRLCATDPHAKKGVWSRRFVVPSQANAAAGESEALEVLAQILMSPGRLVRPAVGDGRPDLIARANYSGANLAGGEFAFAAMGDELAETEAEVDRIIESIRTHGVTEPELARVKARLAADHANGNFDAGAVSGRYDAVALGLSLSRIEDRAASIAKLTTDDIRAGASKYLEPRRAVNALVLPDPAAADENPKLAEAV